MVDKKRTDPTRRKNLLDRLSDLESIEEAQNHYRTKKVEDQGKIIIDSTEKSKQRVDHQLKSIKTLEQAREEDN